MVFIFEKIQFLKISLVFINLYSRSTQLNFKWPGSYIQLTPCHSTYTITSGKYVLDYDPKVTGSYHSDCIFLIESPPGSQIQLNATISILKKPPNDICLNWLKLYDFHSNTTLVPFGEYCESTNITNSRTFSNVLCIVINMYPNDSLQLHITI